MWTTCPAPARASRRKARGCWVTGKRRATSTANASPSCIRRIFSGHSSSWKSVTNNYKEEESMKKSTSRLLATALCVLASGVAAAQNYPDRPIRMLIPFAPGGATDIIGRMIEPKMSRSLGQQIVIDNRSGAAGNIAVELTAQSQPDGYTLLVGNISTNSINPILFAGRSKVNAVKDLAGVTKLVAIPNFLLGSPKMPPTLKEAIEFAKSRPGQLNFGAPLGSYSHLDMLAFTAKAGIKMVHIPTKGAGETLTNLLRNDSNIQISNVASNIGPVRAGQIRAYAVTGAKRIAEAPSVPTMTEAGFPGSG